MTGKLGRMINFLIKKPKRVLEIFFDIVLSSNRVVPFYNPRYPLVLLRAIRLLVGKNFIGQEALQLGILNLDCPETELSKLISRREWTKIQRTLNPASLEPLTENKSIFYRYCKALGIPVPELYAIFLHNTSGFSTKGGLLSSSKDWQAFINTELPSEFIIKRILGSYGAGLMCFVRTKEGFFTDISNGKLCNAKDICDIMFAANNDFIIQKRLINHPELIRLSDTKSLQTFRIWTFVDRNGKSQILHAFFKVIVGQNITDNIEHGISGNLCAEVALDMGTLRSAVKYTPDVSGITTVTSHPETGIPFEGFTIPLWDDTCRLAKEASLKFLPLRIVGWDIAVTSSGPFILEGNIFGDPPNHQRKMDIFLSMINEGR